MPGKRYLILAIILSVLIVGLVYAKNPLDGITCRPPVHMRLGFRPESIFYAAPSTMRSVYNLPTTGGNGTIAIIDAYDNPSIQNDFNKFSVLYGLPTATTTNFEIHKMGVTLDLATQGNWNIEGDLDVEWAHAIAPNCKILFIEATSHNIADLLSAVSYSTSRSDVVSVSMSFGVLEFSSEIFYDNTFISPYGAAFFASSGDSGTGAEYPAASKNVIAVGGTSLTLTGSGVFVSETAWTGSGGGLSKYETEPSFQTTYGVPSTLGFRAVPDVSYNADPNDTPFTVYISLGLTPGYYGVGGTSAGAPQWAAIHALDTTAFNSNFYLVAANSAAYSTTFRDILTGINSETVGFYSQATAKYDYITGLGSPLTTHFTLSVPVELSIFEMDADLP